MTVWVMLCDYPIYPRCQGLKSQEVENEAKTLLTFYLNYSLSIQRR